MAGSLSASAHWTSSDFVVQGELHGGDHSWDLHARLIEARTGEVQAVATASTGVAEPDTQLLQTRLAAGTGYTLALRLNAQVERGEHDGTSHSASPASAAKIVIEQALASN